MVRTNGVIPAVLIHINRGAARPVVVTAAMVADVRIEVAVIAPVTAVINAAPVTAVINAAPVIAAIMTAAIIAAVMTAVVKAGAFIAVLRSPMTLASPVIVVSL